MQTIGQLITHEKGAAQASGSSRVNAPELRRYRVTLVVMIFGHSEIFAHSPLEAAAIAEQNPPERPERDFKTAPVATRLEVWQPWNSTWREVKRTDL